MCLYLYVYVYCLQNNSSLQLHKILTVTAILFEANCSYHNYVTEIMIVCQNNKYYNINIIL